MKYKVAIDCDDVLLELNSKVLQVFNQENGTNYTEDNFPCFDIYQCLPYEHAEKYSLLWLREDIWRSLAPVKHAQKGLKKLIDNGFDVYIVTSTHYSNFALKIDLLKAYFPFIDISRVVCIKDKGLLNVDVMVDDCTDQLLANMYCNRVCFDRPWNRNINDDVYCITRCSTWEEIVSTVKQMYMEEELLTNKKSVV